MWFAMVLNGAVLSIVIARGPVLSPFEVVDLAVFEIWRGLWGSEFWGLGA